MTAIVIRVAINVVEESSYPLTTNYLSPFFFFCVVKLIVSTGTYSALCRCISEYFLVENKSISNRTLPSTENQTLLGAFSCYRIKSIT